MKSTRNGLKAVALLEAFKGIVSLLVAFGLHALAGQNLQQFAETVVRHTHLNPANHLPSVFINTASKISEGQMSLFAIGALAYSLVRLVEAYGLWKGFVWTEWFALLSGAIYIPFEIYEIIFHTHILAIGIFLLNVVVVAYMAHVLFGHRRDRMNPV